MKITFNPVGTQETEKQYTDKRDIGKTAKSSNAYNAVFMSEANAIWGAGTISGKERGKSLIELQQEAGNVNVAVQQDYMTLMSHTMSEKDYAKLSEEGFHFDNMDPETAVTIVDKIKAELARSGQYIAGYTDDLDMDTLAAAVGSDALARTISDAFAKADIPMTQENIDSVARAWDMASQLETPDEGASRYMIDNGLEPEIWNLYLAQSSGAKGVSSGSPRYYAEEIQGYFTQSAGQETNVGLQAQIDKVITEAKMEVNEESRKQAEWLIQKGLPLTAENLMRLDELQDIAFPIDEDKFVQSVTAAVAEGKEPIYANLSHNENLYEKAAYFAENYYNDRIRFLDEEDITARRQLEEIRLRMTAEVNVKLLKSGFSIDTAPMEQLLEALKQAEAQIANNYFPKDADAVGKYELYRQTATVVTELPHMPAQILGSWSAQEVQGSISTFHAEGKALKQAYDNARESYETLMTAPRGDLGDSIHKAFANVDDILEDMGYELTEENRRAIRILGYNRMNMTPENVESIKAVDAQVRSVIEKMTPAATLKMIRDGVNPLEQSFAELEEYFNTLPEEYRESAESYSRFLYQLEQHKEISSQEREAYIGIYRLLRQIEKSDGAVIGAVVNSQMELQFNNLLAAVRSNRFKHMDARATDETGLMAELMRKGNSISEQIANIVTEVSSDEAVDKEYTHMLLEQTRQAANTDGDSAALLQRGDMPANTGNLLAAQALLHDADSPFKKWKDKTKQLHEEAGQEMNMTDASDSVWENLSDKTSFRDSYMEMLSELSKQVEDATLNLAENSLDVRELQLMHKQFSVAASLASSEEYILPMYVGEELTKVHLTLERGKTQKGEVSVRVDFAQDKQVEAHFRLQGKCLNGFLVGNTDEEVTKLQRTADIFHELVQNNSSVDWQIEKISVVSGNATRNPVLTSAKGFHDLNAEEPIQQTSNEELYQIAKLFLQAIKN